ncbi:MAG TPA: hypothetical protein VGP35_04640 [Terriglobales bacterium]|nr:hypothetical protein [Terriglobales bacterium]
MIIVLSIGFLSSAGAQQSSQPQVKVNMLNVCSPSAEEQQEIASALARIPKQPSFSPDFEVDRGRSTLDEQPDFLKSGGNAQLASDSGTADWVRIRREFPAQAAFSTVQYSFSQDPKNMVETLIFHVRDPKDLMQVAIEDNASSVTTPTAMLGTNTPAGRIKLERFGKSSVVLARCAGTEGNPAPDQSAYEPLFKTATTIVTNYRNLLAARASVPAELARVNSVAGTKSKPPTKSAAKKSEPAKSTPEDK